MLSIKTTHKWFNKARFKHYYLENLTGQTHRNNI